MISVGWFLSFNEFKYLADNRLMKFVVFFIFLFTLNSANAFFSRWITDPTEECAKESESDELNRVGCLTESDEYFLSTSLEKLSENLKRKVVRVHDDILASKKLSEKIINQSINAQDKYKDIKKEFLLAPGSKGEDSFSNALNVYANLENKITSMAKKHRCQPGRHSVPEQVLKYERCQQKLAELMEPLLYQKGLLVTHNPLLANQNVQELVEDKIDDYNSKYSTEYQKIRNCKHKKRRMSMRSAKSITCKSSKEVDLRKSKDHISIESGEYSEAFLEALDDSLKAAKKLEKRHSKVHSKIIKFQSKSRPLYKMNSFRDSLLHDREISTDYYVSAGPNEGYGKFGNFQCRLLGEYSANERNAFINSIALDVALMAIPLGGPLLMARAAMRLEKIARLSSGTMKTKKLASVTKHGTIGAELVALGADTKNLTDEFGYCEDLIAKAASLNSASTKVSGPYNECQEKLSAMTSSYVAATLGGAVGIFNMPKSIAKLFPQKGADASIKDPVLSLPSERVIGNEALATFSTVKSTNGFPLINTRDMEAISLAPKDSKIMIETSGDFTATQSRSVSPDELEELLKKEELSEFKVSGIEYQREFSSDEASVISSKIPEKELGYLDYDESMKMTFVAEYKSGEVGVYTGNSSMIKELALRDDIAKLDYTLTPSRNIESGHNVSQAQRSSLYDVDSAMLAKVNPDSVSTINKSSADGFDELPIFHGTIKGLADSVRSGPKNLGKGFGGRGLYLDISPDAKIAETYSELAKEAAVNRMANIDPDAAKNISKVDTSSVVLKGKLNLNDDKDLVVGRFEIRRGGEIDLEKGILPANWDEDPRLAKMMEEKFDILDLRGMKSNGLNLDTDRILVVHERAGANIIKWE